MNIKFYFEVTVGKDNWDIITPVIALAKLKDNEYVLGIGFLIFTLTIAINHDTI